jgi:hypothetical protein
VFVFVYSSVASQRAIRRRIRRKYALMLGPSSLYALKYRVRRWVKKAGRAIEERSTDIIKKYLTEMRASNKLLTIVKVFTRKVVMCQRYIRAFLQGQRTRKVHMHNLWDEVTKDVIGGSEKNAWMYRVLEKSNAKSERCSKELRNMRAVFMHELRFHKNSIKAFQSKIEAFELIKDMGMDQKFIKERMGINLMPRSASATVLHHPCLDSRLFEPTSSSPRPAIRAGQNGVPCILPACADLLFLRKVAIVPARVQPQDHAEAR